MCYYCLLMLKAGMDINYTYTIPITGVVSGTLNSLTSDNTIRTILNALGLTTTTNVSFTTDLARRVGLQSETRVDGMEVCRFHIGMDRRLG